MATRATLEAPLMPPTKAANNATGHEARSKKKINFIVASPFHPHQSPPC